jgi:hypothetical protein
MDTVGRPVMELYEWLPADGPYSAESGPGERDSGPDQLKNGT